MKKFMRIRLVEALLFLDFYSNPITMITQGLKTFNNVFLKNLPTISFLQPSIDEDKDMFVKKSVKEHFSFHKLKLL